MSGGGGTCNPLKKVRASQSFRGLELQEGWVKMSVGVNYQEGAAINTDFPFCLAVEATMVCDTYEIIGKC